MLTIIPKASVQANDGKVQVNASAAVGTLQGEFKTNAEGFEYLCVKEN